MLGHAGLAGVLATAQHAGLGLGKQGFQNLQFPALGMGAYIMGSYGVQPVGLHAGGAHQTGAHQQFQHRVPHKGQCQGGHFVDIHFRFCFKQHTQYR